MTESAREPDTDGRQSDVEQLLADLVRIETENPPGNEKACAEYVVEWFRERGVESTLLAEPDPDRPQAVATVGSGDPTVVLNGHLDVVPAGDREQWSVDPYGAEVRDGRLYGRGAVDMKAGVAVAMTVAAALADEIEGSLSGSLVVQAAMGEETAEPGTRALLEAGYDGDYGVVLEPTELRTATSQTGLAYYDITVDGDPAHASRPGEGDNAVMNARHVLDALAAYDSELRTRQDPLVGSASATVGVFEGGTKANVVPEEATIAVDRRINPGETIEAVDEEIESLVQRVRAEHDIAVEWDRREFMFTSASIPQDSPLAAVFRDHTERVAGVSTEPWGTRYASDVRHFVNDAGIPAITWGPGDVDQAHAVDEYVDLDQVDTAVTVLEAALRDLLA